MRDIFPGMREISVPRISTLCAVLRHHEDRYARSGRGLFPPLRMLAEPAAKKMKSVDPVCLARLTPFKAAMNVSKCRSSSLLAWVLVAGIFLFLYPFQVAGAEEKPLVVAAAPAAVLSATGNGSGAGTGTGAPSVKSQSSRTVQVARTAVRSAPSAISLILGYLEYGTRVGVTVEQDGWVAVLVVGDPPVGWVRASALTPRRLAPAKGNPARPEVDESEIVLAGRGFSRAVEDSLRNVLPLDYAWIDIMEGYGMEENEAWAFLEPLK